MKKIYVYTNTNCRRRLLDANKLKLYFNKNNYTLVKKPEDSDFIIYITCAYRNEITNDTLTKFKDLQKYKAELIVAGCLPVIEEIKLNQIFKGKTISTKNLDKIDVIFPNNKIKFSSLTDSESISQEQYINHHEENYKLKNFPFLNKYYNYFKENFIFYLLNKHLLIYLFPSKTDFYHVRISWGCMGNCSYCGIKKAIGALKSKPINECIDDFEKGLKAKYKMFVITADDVGAFGVDIGSNFPILLDKLTSFEGEYEISVQDLDPRWVVKYIDELEPIFKKGKITSVNIALQSGCDKILKLMNRYHDIEKIKESLIRLKNCSTKLSLDTHFILGFPTETDKDFLQTIDFIKIIDFDMGFIYRFSCKTGTEAEKIEPKVSNDDIIKRMNYAKKLLKNHEYKVITLSKNSYYTFYKTK
jgi:tRNA A37 methylthiotransferase MiaB